LAGGPELQPGPLADRLDHLFRTVHPKDRGPYTPGEVAAAVNDRAGEHVISSTYVWQLRTGRRDNPTQRHLSALATFFGVSPLYFFDDEGTAQQAVSPELAVALQDEDLRAVALRAAGLSERALRAIREMVESARVIEGLDSGARMSRRDS
jgi:transcriptional regulator with XRE-family HTH domain